MQTEKYTIKISDLTGGKKIPLSEFMIGGQFPPQVLQLIGRTVAERAGLTIEQVTFKLANRQMRIKARTNKIFVEIENG